MSYIWPLFDSVSLKNRHRFNTLSTLLYSDLIWIQLQMFSNLLWTFVRSCDNVPKLETVVCLVASHNIQMNLNPLPYRSVKLSISHTAVKINLKVKESRWELFLQHLDLRNFCSDSIGTEHHMTDGLSCSSAIHSEHGLFVWGSDPASRVQWHFSFLQGIKVKSAKKHENLDQEVVGLCFLYILKRHPNHLPIFVKVLKNMDVF